MKYVVRQLEEGVVTNAKDIPEGHINTMARINGVQITTNMLSGIQGAVECMIKLGIKKMEVLVEDD